MQPRIDSLIDLALDEDVAFGDVTSQSIFAVDHISKARILAREDMVVCGLEIAKRVFHRVDSALKVDVKAKDGDQVSEGSTVLVVEGSTISILTAERTALNFLQRLSGIASLSRRFADAARDDRNRCAYCRYTKNDTWLAGAGKICRAMRRLLQSPLFPERTCIDQGKSHHRGRFTGKGRENGPRFRTALCKNRGRDRKPG